MTPEDRVRAALAELGDALVALATSAGPVTAPPVELLTVDAFAKRVGISRSTLYAAVAAGEVRSCRLRNRRLIPGTELVRIASGEPAERIAPTARRGPGRPRRLPNRPAQE